MKDEKELQDKELDQVNGGNMFESLVDRDCEKFYERVGVKLVDAPWFEHNAYTFRGKQYNSRSDLWEALDKAGVKPEKEVRTGLSGYDGYATTSYK